MTSSTRGPCGPLDLKDRIVLITGGGSGIGFAFAQLCLAASARVVIGDINLTPEVRSAFESAGSSQVINRKCDVTSWDDLHDLISASVEAFGDVPDVYAPVAGIFEPRWSNFWDDTIKGGDGERGHYATLRINVDHPIRLTRLAMKALAGAEKQGVVCLVSSTAGVRPNYLASLYSASKFAVRGFTMSMGQADKDEGVRVVCMMPGLVDSELWRKRDDSMFEEAKFEERKALMPKDIAEVMIRMVEDKEGMYSGGTCVMKTPYEEKVIEKGWKEGEKENQYDPSPRPEPALKRVREAIDPEVGRGWVRREDGKEVDPKI